MGIMADNDEQVQLPSTTAQRDKVLMIAIARRRDQKALAELFGIYGPKLKGWLIARGVQAGSAEDVIQDVMIRVWTRAETFDPERAAFSTWVYRLTRNRWIDIQRKNQRMDIRDPMIMNIIADDIVPSVEDDFTRGQIADRLHEELESLKPSHKELVHMAFMEHKTHAEISDETGIPLGTVKTRIRSAMKFLRAKIGEDSDD